MEHPPPKASPPTSWTTSVPTGGWSRKQCYGWEQPGTNEFLSQPQQASAKWYECTRNKKRQRLEYRTALPQHRPEPVGNQESKCSSTLNLPRPSKLARMTTATLCPWCENLSAMEHLRHCWTTTVSRPFTGAGLVIFAGQWTGTSFSPQAICLVRSARGHWGLPKGAARVRELPPLTASREWLEETGIPLNYVHILDSTAILDSHGVHFFMGLAKRPCTQYNSWHSRNYQGHVPVLKARWTPPMEDPDDPSPVVECEWMSIEDAGQALSRHHSQVLNCALHKGPEMFRSISEWD